MASRLITHPDAHAKALAYYHTLNVALVAAAPIAVLAHPSPLSTPVDLAIGIALPIHAHVGMMNVISDYAPKISKHAAAPMRASMAGLTAVTIAGLLRLNLQGAGITETAKSLWRTSATSR